MVRQMSCKFAVLVLALAAASATAAEHTPEVTLSHGGILKGQTTLFQNAPVDIFLGIRYAKPPTNELRYKKPVEYPGWEGPIEATSVGSKCPQLGPAGLDGNEDCLFMDITIPKGIKPGAKKPVMVWIHGGAFKSGVGSVFIGAPLAVVGDVIVVTFNYRIGILGFLADGPGTGNYGLWDQRAALVWVQKNIAAFGGDPDMVTIFGESAGGGSASAHTMSPHSKGLFKRAIQQSGTLYQLLATPKMKSYLTVQSIKQQTACDQSKSVYECLTGMSTLEIFFNIKLAPELDIWHPVADNDFLNSDVDDYSSYTLSQRFDLMVGMNGQDGGLLYSTDTAALLAMMRNQSVENGVSKEFTEEYLTLRCRGWFTPYSAELCADFIINAYKLDDAEGDKDRARKLTEFLTEAFFAADVSNLLEQHSSSDKSTYAYHFTELVNTGNPLWKMPEWLKTSADHADELPFLFGGAYYKEETNPLWDKLFSTDGFLHAIITGGSKESDKPLSKAMMILWSNFAKTGNPNMPMPLPEGAPTWPEYNVESSQFIELHSNQIKVVPTPHKERVDRLRSRIFSARNLQFQALRLPEEEEKRWINAKSETKSHDEL